ncbi:flagellar protein FliT [Virgibacillus sp. W0181]|uniref:flagellar protein FliT n=1 Tax=Virgibacillus sp. W0181 TaxID=3391581 RepID=UPI003F462699
MNQLEHLYNLTIKLENILEQPVTINTRDEVIAAANQLINERAVYIEQMKPPYTEQEEQIGKQIIASNEKIKLKMNNLFDELKQDMKQVKKQKKSNRTYINPYGKLQTTDGMYMDSKQ